MSSPGGPRRGGDGGTGLCLPRPWQPGGEVAAALKASECCFSLFDAIKRWGTG